MNGNTPCDSRCYSLIEAMQARITAYLQEEFEKSEGPLGGLDQWTRRHVMAENLAKLDLVLQSDQPSESCYRDLIREIDAEAQSGIFLARSDAAPDHLRGVVGEPGVSGELHGHMHVIAPVLFADELAHSADDRDLVWVSLWASHDRARIDAAVSQIIMSFLVDDANTVADMTQAIRSLQYAFHEEMVRRATDLPSLLSDRESRELFIMVMDLEERAGSYEKRVAEIRGAADRA